MSGGALFFAVLAWVVILGAATISLSSCKAQQVIKLKSPHPVAF